MSTSDRYPTIPVTARTLCAFAYRRQKMLFVEWRRLVVPLCGLQTYRVIARPGNHPLKFSISGLGLLLPFCRPQDLPRPIAVIDSANSAYRF
jgi:hypothetical protein